MMELKFKEVGVEYNEKCERNENILIKPYMTLDELSTTYYDMMADVKGSRKDALNRHFTKIINMMKFCTNIDCTELSNEEIYDVCYENQLVNDFEYLISEYKKMGISFPPGATDFYQKVPSEFMKRGFAPKLNDSENIWAYIKGSEKPDEILVISAHYDHVGMKNGETTAAKQTPCIGTKERN